MKDQWDAVAAFMEAGDQTIGQENAKYIHRYRWPYLNRVDDELTETCHAIADDDEVEIADGYADIIYAAMTGLLNLAGREKAEAIFQAVVDANTTKIDGSLGPVRRDENGKILKPAGFVPPNQKIKEILGGITMSIKEAQEWLSQRSGPKQPLYAVMVQLDGDGDTDYRLVCGEQNMSSSFKTADWTSLTFAREVAHRIITKVVRIKNGKYEVTRVFIVKKDTNCRIISEVKADAEES